jgi:phage terminase small subunit
MCGILKNAKHEMFCQEYLRDLNGTQAAIRAGYSAKTANEQASQLLANLSVHARVEELKAIRMIRTEVDQDFVVTSLIEIAQRCMQKRPVMVFDRVEREMVQATEEVEDEETGKLVEADVWQFDAKGANQALELLGKHCGMFNKLELTGKDGVPLFKDLAAALVGLDDKCTGTSEDSTEPS